MTDRPAVPPDAFVVASDKDLGFEIYGAQQEAVRAGRPALTVLIEPGTYRGVNVGLEDGPPEIRIVSRGPQPAVLEDCTLRIEAHSVFLENLAFTNHRGAGWPLQLVVSGSVHAERLVFLGNESGDVPTERGGAASAGRIVSILGRPQEITPPVDPTAALARCWFLGNTTYGPAGSDNALIYAERMEALTLEDCLFADNEAGYGVANYGVSQISLDRCLVQERLMRTSWLRHAAQTAIVFRRGLLALTTSRFSRSYIPVNTPPETIQPILIANSLYALIEPLAPNLVRLENARPVAPPQLPANLADLALDAGRPDTVDLMVMSTQL